MIGATSVGRAPGEAKRPGGRGRQRLALALLLALPLAACAHRKAAPPTAEAPQQRPPQLAGQTVMVLPAQPSNATPQTVTSAFDAEIAYWLGERAPRVHWIGAGELERIMLRSPGLGIDIHALDARAFGRMRVTRVGDPLFGDLRRLGVIAAARWALLPVSLSYASGRLETAAALIDSESGDVFWFGVAAGEPGPIDSPAAVASTARALAKALVPDT